MSKKKKKTHKNNDSVIHYVPQYDGLTTTYCIKCLHKLNIVEPKDILKCPYCGWGYEKENDV